MEVELRVQQVRDGWCYEGYVQIGTVQFDYRLNFDVPVPKINEVDPTIDIAAIRQLFQITLQKGGVVVALTDQEFGFFCRLIVPFAVEFYHSPMTREHNEGFLSLMSVLDNRLQGLIPGVSVTLQVTGSRAYEFNPELQAWLSSPKFGCKFIK